MEAPTASCTPGRCSGKAQRCGGRHLPLDTGHSAPALGKPSPELQGPGLLQTTPREVAPRPRTLPLRTWRNRGLTHLSQFAGCWEEGQRPPQARPPVQVTSDPSCPPHPAWPACTESAPAVPPLPLAVLPAGSSPSALPCTPTSPGRPLGLQTCTLAGYLSDCPPFAPGRASTAGSSAAKTPTLPFALSCPQVTIAVFTAALSQLLSPDAICITHFPLGEPQGSLFS